MDFTIEIGNKYGVTPFEILKQDKDHVIMVINYFIEKGQNKEQHDTYETGVMLSEKEIDRSFWNAL